MTYPTRHSWLFPFFVCIILQRPSGPRLLTFSHIWTQILQCITHMTHWRIRFLIHWPELLLFPLSAPPPTPPHKLKIWSHVIWPPSECIFTSNSIILMAVRIWLLRVVTVVLQQLIVRRHAWSILAESAPSGLAEILFLQVAKHLRVVSF